MEMNNLERQKYRIARKTTLCHHCEREVRQTQKRIYTFTKEGTRLIFCSTSCLFTFQAENKEIIAEYWWMLGRKLVSGGYLSREAALEEAKARSFYHIYGQELILVCLVQEPINLVMFDDEGRKMYRRKTKSRHQVLKEASTL